MVQQRRRDGAPLPPVEIGVGIATGPAIAGGFGGHDRMGYSVNGDPVTLAGRIQGLSHQYGPAVIVSDATRNAAARSFAFLEVDTVAAGPSDPPTTLYAILGNPVVRASPKFRALATFHDRILQALRKQLVGLGGVRSGHEIGQEKLVLHHAPVWRKNQSPPARDAGGACYARFITSVRMS